MLMCLKLLDEPDQMQHIVASIIPIRAQLFKANDVVS